MSQKKKTPVKYMPKIFKDFFENPSFENMDLVHEELYAYGIDPYLEGALLFSIIQNSTDNIVKIPEAWYAKYMNYFEKTEQYEYCTQLKKLEDKIVNKTFEEIVKEDSKS